MEIIDGNNGLYNSAEFVGGDSTFYFEDGRVFKFKSHPYDTPEKIEAAKYPYCILLADKGWGGTLVRDK